MNKKFATLMFALGLGTASAPAFASCDFICYREHVACLANGQYSDAECDVIYEACATACHGCPDQAGGVC